MMAVGGLAIAAGAVFAAGVVFYMALLTGWWWLLGVLVGLAVIALGAIVVGVAGACGAPTDPIVRIVRLTAGVGLVLFTVVGFAVRYSS